ncbi:MAG: hypothetical protein R3309_08595, partial [Reinekea sp.]|nr:hypothetical protein [Reinekea sp.]
ESISLSGVTAGSLTLAGDFSWNFNPTLTGAYQQTKGDVTLTDTTLRASSVDMSLADSVTLTGTATVVEATAGNVGINGLTGAGSDLTINASGDINLDSIVLGTGDLTLRSDTDASGGGTAFLNIGSGNALTLNSQSTLSGAINFNQLSSSAVVTLSDATLTLNSLDTSAWTGGVLTGTSNGVTATTGNIAVSNWVQGAGSSSLSLTATGAIDVSGVTVGNQLTVNSATNQTTLTTVAANGLNANEDNLTLTGNLQLNSLVTSGSLSLTDAALAVTGFDSGDYTQVSFAGTSNSLTVNGGNLILNTPTMTLGSDLSLNVGAGSHVLTHLNVGSGDIQINGVAATSNQTVTANGAWTFDQLTVAGIDTFINNAQLNGTSLVTIATTNDIDLNDSSALSAERIELTADDDIWLTGLASASPQIPSIVVRAGGDILDGGDTQFDIDAYWEESVDLQAGGTIDNSLLFQYDVVVDLELDAGIDLSTDTNDLVISDASESKNPTQSSQASVGSLPRSSVDVYLPECSNGSKDCRKTSALRKFLSSLLVGGALPE